MKNFFTEKGQHAIIYGQTGSGKTTLQLEFVKIFYNGQKETILWRDTGKGSECAALGLISDLKFFCPEGCGVSFKNPISDYEMVPFSSYSDIFNGLDPKKINIISERMFLRDPYMWTGFWGYFFRELVERAYKKQLPVPLALFLDELNQLTPTRDKSLDRRQNYTSSMVAHNLENLRACGVRVIATSQGIRKLLKAVRDNFPWKFFKRIDEDPSEESYSLKTAVHTIQSLRRDSFVILTPLKIYSNPVRPIPDWRLGELGRKHHVEYWGDIPRNWECMSEYKEEDDKKDRKGEALKNIVKHIYKHEKYTQKKLATVTGYSQKAISDIVNS